MLRKHFRRLEHHKDKASYVPTNFFIFLLHGMRLAINVNKTYLDLHGINFFYH